MTNMNMFKHVLLIPCGVLWSRGGGGGGSIRCNRIMFYLLAINSPSCILAVIY
ncbi:hypothetical protein OIU79_004272 [Salix purpurea]|uniref:Uncharacterized protein n=1 Tax=Salix purpurea TaxID=77065 RepID=A0A9Q0U9R6_SALPP|nr:hypothetical protein OIU79_004272 [Salix purpurea]